MPTTTHVIIKGRVQGVGYRNWTVTTARRLRLNGWVKNTPDGSVEAVFSGEEVTVRQIIKSCYSGPRLAEVSSIEERQIEDWMGEGFSWR